MIIIHNGDDMKKKQLQLPTYSQLWDFFTATEIT